MFLLAERWVNDTSNNIFLTGKAGTGKTTFLKHIKETGHKNTVVLAPTGIAAINAGGSTLHSFFRLPFGTFIPSYTVPEGNENIITLQSLPTLIRYTRQHIQLLRTIELVIIDEVSMVRADVLDMIDAILRRFRMAQHLPFGGVQMLFIGDMHQLPPVVKEQEARLLGAFYSSPFFFDSHVLKEVPPVIIQLEKVYRQQDEDFLTLLNELRHNAVSPTSYEMLLSKVTNTPPTDERYITLTTHVAQADRINAQAMQQLVGTETIFEAVVEGDFPEHSYPAATKLALKPGARVMFIKNDPERNYFNGKTGKITAIHDERVEVQCDDGTTVTVSPIVWNNVKFSTNAETGGIEEQVLGKFWQIPLRLAWAVTIHKSQGLTFDKVIIDAERSFAAGQVYVALSRCRTWEGIVLLSQITPQSLLTDINVVNFTVKTWKQEHLEQSLPEQQHRFQSQKIAEAFTLSAWHRYAEQIEKILAEYDNSFSQATIECLKQLSDSLRHLASTAEKFSRQANTLITPDVFPEADATLLKRLSEAATYFSTYNRQHILQPLEALPTAPDNAQASTRTLQLLELIREASMLHQLLWLDIIPGFSAKNMLRTKAKAIQEIAKNKALRWQKLTNIGSIARSSKHTALEADIRAWRIETADTHGIELYRVLTNAAIDDIITNPPRNKKELLATKGVGTKKVREYGAAILEIVGRHYDLVADEEPEQPTKPKKEAPGATHRQTLALFRSGMPIADIARERNYAQSTIHGHFSKLIKDGLVRLDELLSADQTNAIRKSILEAPDKEHAMKYTKERLGDGVEYHEIRWMMDDMRREGILPH